MTRVGDKPTGSMLPARIRANQFPSIGGVPAGRGGCFGGIRWLATVETVNHPVRLRLPPLLWRGICRGSLSFNVFLYADFWQNLLSIIWVARMWATRPPTLPLQCTQFIANNGVLKRMTMTDPAIIRTTTTVLH